MEEKFLRNLGMETVSSSELLMVRGGIGFNDIRRILEIIGAIIDAVEEYSDDFIRGFKKGWKMI